MGDHLLTEPEHVLDPPVPVTVEIKGVTWPGVALRWRGQVVLVKWTEGPGLNHLTWEPAGAVTRT